MADELVLQGLEVVGNRESFVTDFKHSAGLFAFLPAPDFKNNPSAPAPYPAQIALTQAMHTEVTE